ncbi:MAG: fimbria/pilus periplasmic chaperone [Deltaproteobacteria bacterium]
MSLPRLLPMLLFGLLGLRVSAAWGAAVSINPVRVQLSASQRSEVIELKNAGQAPARFQAEAQAWHETAVGQMTLSPTKDLLFFPSLFEIPPGETRRIRIASTVRPGPVERSYRLILTEFPGGSTPGTVQVLSRLSIPVFVQPKDPKPAPSVQAEVQGGQLVLRIANAGNAYFRAQLVRVVARSKKGDVVFEHSFRGWYVLAKGERRYNVDVPAQTCAEIATLHATLRGEQGDASATSAIRPGAGCGS